MRTPDSSAEEQLKQELREMFLLETQQQLETYFDVIHRLNSESWIADIQSIYRAIHTIKGGAVTVDANSTLYGAMALEDLLSDLRYLEVAPPLSDGRLREILLEAGELLASCLEIAESGNAGNYANMDDGNRVQLTIQRLQTLHAQVKEEYLPDWNEMRQVHQEFAEQGFDLVVLDLEMALATIPSQIVPPNIVALAQSTISQLTHIGAELDLASGWTLLLQVGDRLIRNPDRQLWQTVWLPYFHVLKTCVKNGGEIDPREIERLDTLEHNVQIADPALVVPSCEFDDDQVETSEDLSDLLDNLFAEEDVSSVGVTAMPTAELPSSEIPADLSVVDLASHEPIGSINEFLPIAVAATEDLPDLLDNFFVDAEDLPDFTAVTATPPLVANSQVAEIDLAPVTIISPADESQWEEVAAAEDLSGLLDDFFIDEDIELAAPDLQPAQSIAFEEQDLAPNLASGELVEFTEISELDEFDLMAEIGREFVATNDAITSDSSAVGTIGNEHPSSVATIDPLEVKRGISIPVPLERLDQSAQQVVDTLLTARAVMNASSKLKSQLSQLNTLTQESSQFITGLRQLQDNYALLRSISTEQDSGNNVTIERYRQGYTTIIRLLENMLRMSEIGQEIETANYENTNYLEALDRSIVRLKDGIETSRLVPFRNLTLRAKAILRDLTNRYGKPAELIVKNERVELDAGIVQQLEPALLHILRNAYDHGLETVEQRLAAGKPAQGTISISLHRRGNLYRLEVADDGHGIDANIIYQLAQAKGFNLDRQTDDRGDLPLTASEILAIICQPGFSSSSNVSEVSGRGVGMDVVAAQIASVGGKLSLETVVGRGTKFAIEVPAHQLLVPCVLFQVGDRTVAFPTEEVLETALLSSLVAKMSTADRVGMCGWTLTTSRGDVSGFDLANYWHFAQRSLPETAICIRTRQGSEGEEIWSIADDLVGQAELLINPLPRPLIAPAGLLGVSLQSDGRLISILDPISLTTKLSNNSDRDTDYGLSGLAISSEGKSVNDSVKQSAPIILIVDDAALIRRRFEASLSTYGFITHTCNDGLEALNWLQTNPLPDLMITDVEMPNMDGFTLIDRARQAKIDIPILVVSSRSSEEWGKEARRLGASDYLNKGFSTAEMLQKVNSLLGLLAKV